MHRAEAIYKALTQEPPSGRLERLTELFKRCELSVNDRTEDIAPLLEELKAETGQTWTAEDFSELWGWTSPEELAADWSVRVPAPVDLTEEELAALLGMIDVNTDRIVRFFGDAFGPAFPEDLIFYPYRDMNPSELATEVFHRRQLLAGEGLIALNAYERNIAHDIKQNADAKPWELQWAEGKLPNN